MGEDDLTQPGTYINRGVWEEFRKDVKERRGGIRGHLRSELENAIQEYIDASHGGDVNDRLRRLEAQMEEVHGVVTEERKKNKGSDVSQETKNKLSAIKSQIQQEIGDADKAHVSVVNKAIEDHAGSSRPTLKRYKEMLEQRHIAHEWPSEESDTWWFDNEKFVRVVDKEFDYYTLTDKYGGEWYDEMLEQIEEDNGGVGFQ